MPDAEPTQAFAPNCFTGKSARWCKCGVAKRLTSVKSNMARDQDVVVCTYFIVLGGCGSSACPVLCAATTIINSV
jgi:hypothetical protein